MKVTPIYALLFAFSMLAGAEASDAQSTKEAHTAEAVMAADRGWGAAEEKGDVAYVDALLLPEYRSISPDGRIHDKEAILAGTRKANAASAAATEKYLADHPSDMAVVLNGDVAVLTFTAKNDAQKLIRSCDIFVYRSGHWRAIYSQHTNAQKA